MFKHYYFWVVLVNFSSFEIFIKKIKFIIEFCSKYISIIYQEKQKQGYGDLND